MKPYDPKRQREYYLRWYSRHKTEHDSRVRANHVKLKHEVVEHYSNGTNACACCGESEPMFLAIDHINGGGHTERKLHGSGVRFYFYLRSHGFPKGYQVLCHNCNVAKGANRTCPHQAELLKKNDHE